MNAKKLVLRLLNGLLCGIGIDYIVAILLSMRLNLGYFMPCLSTLPELAGGEMNAILLQAAAFALPCAGISVALGLRKNPLSRKPAINTALLVLVLLLALLPTACLAAALLGNMPY